MSPSITHAALPGRDQGTSPHRYKKQPDPSMDRAAVGYLPRRVTPHNPGTGTGVVMSFSHDLSAAYLNPLTASRIPYHLNVPSGFCVRYKIASPLPSVPHPVVYTVAATFTS